jgi:hypothetical protein
MLYVYVLVCIFVAKKVKVLVMEGLGGLVAATRTLNYDAPNPVKNARQTHMLCSLLTLLIPPNYRVRIVSSSKLYSICWHASLLDHDGCSSRPFRTLEVFQAQRLKWKREEQGNSAKASKVYMVSC